MDNIMDNSMNQTPDNTGRTFTQDEVNKIVQDRLAKEKAKSSTISDLDKRESEIAARELRVSARETLAEKNLPSELLDALNMTDEETMKKSVDVIESIINATKDTAATATAEQKAPPTFVGFKPGVSNVPTSELLKTNEEQALRKAMRLPND